MTGPRIVHIGDVHLQAGHPRNATRLQSLDQIIDEQEGAAALWLGPGDLFHQKSTAQDRNDLASRLLRMTSTAPVVLLRGNHDAPGDLDIFARLRGRWPVHVVTRPCVLEVVLSTMSVAVACVPYPEKAGLVSAGVEKSAIALTATELLDTIFMQLADELARFRALGFLTLFCGHFNVRGSIASTGQPQIGQEPEADRLSLERLGAAYCALNHIHKAQEVGCGVYAGSIAPMDFGEVEAKSYVVVEASRTDAGWMADWCRVQLHTPRLVRVEGTLTRDGFLMRATPESENFPTSWEGCEVRVRYSYKASEKALLDEARIRDQFADALRLKIESVVEPDRDIRSPQVAAATTLEAKVAAYLGGPLAIGIQQKLALLQNEDSDHVLDDVAAQLAETERPEKAEAAA